ncbi:MAG: hypothetical protein HC888_17990, partial [Candidatus Competibacteraceae bacterium]|nr:hypothetical protein [Candidatus Competibacteraceae bacterium]
MARKPAASRSARPTSTSPTSGSPWCSTPATPRDASHGHIRFGLSAVKGVGDKAIATILDERRKDGPFTSLCDFCERVA